MVTRRQLLGTLSVGAAGSLSGCSSLPNVGGDGSPCANNSALLSPALVGWRLTFLGEQTAENQKIATRIASTAQERGHPATMQYLPTYLTQADDSIWEVMVYGRGVGRAEVRTILQEAEIERRIETTPNEAVEIPDGSSSGGLLGGKPDIISARAKIYNDARKTVRAGVPKAVNPSSDGIYLKQTPSDETLGYLQQVFASRSYLTVEVTAGDQYYRDANYNNPTYTAQEGWRHAPGDVSIKNTGVVNTGLTSSEALRAMYPPAASGRGDLKLDEGRIRLSLNGVPLELRRPTVEEERYLINYFKYTEGELNSPPSAPALRFTTLDDQTAVLAAVLLSHPTDVRFGLKPKSC